MDSSFKIIFLSSHFKYFPADSFIYVNNIYLSNECYVVQRDLFMN